MTTLPEITMDDCQKIIKSKFKTDQFRILSHKQIPFDALNGYLGVHSTLEVTIQRKSTEETTFSFFVKHPPQVESQRNFLEEINGIFKERNFFLRYCPKLKEHGITILEDTVPQCYHFSDGTFFFENLTKEGYSTFPSRVPLALEFVKAGLSAFAKLHASGLILEEMNSCPLTDDFQTELKESFYLEVESTKRALKSCKQGLMALIDLTHPESSEIPKDTFKAKAATAIDLQKVFTTPSKKFRNTVCHADPWTKNFLFKKDGSVIKCKIVDFQTYRYGPPAQDVMAFIHLVTDRETRRRHMEEMLEFYYGELRIAMGEYGFGGTVTKEEFLESCGFYKGFALMQTLTHFQVVILSDEIGAELFGDPEYARYVLFEDKYEFIKMVCERDEVYKERCREAIDDLREFYERKLKGLKNSVAD